MQSVILSTLCGSLGWLMEQDDCEIPIANEKYRKMELMRQRRSKHAVTSVRGWNESYGVNTQAIPYHVPSIKWVNDQAEAPITSVVSLDVLDSDLFQDTTLPVSYCTNDNMKSILKVGTTCDLKYIHSSSTTPPAASPRSRHIGSSR